MPTSTNEHVSTIDPSRAGALLVAVQRGHAGAFDDLVRVCQPLVRRHAMRYAWRRNDVDDVVQEVCVRLFRKADQIREPSSLTAWLNIVTRRAAQEIGRRESRMVPTQMSDHHPSASSTEDEALASHQREDVTRRVRGALDRLDDDDRHLLLMLHRSDRPGYEEISREVQRPVGSLGPSRGRLLERLRHDARLASLRDHPMAS